MQAGTHPKPNTVKLGQTLIKIGLIIQLTFFAFFVLTSIIFHTRLGRNPTSATIHGSIPWKKYMWALYASSVLIFVRSMFRLAEYSGGANGKLLSKEWYSYVFDGCLMWGVMVGFNFVYPGSIKKYERTNVDGDERGMVPLSEGSSDSGFGRQSGYTTPKPYTTEGSSDNGFGRQSGYTTPKPYNAEGGYVAPGGYAPQAGYRPYGA